MSRKRNKIRHIVSEYNFHLDRFHYRMHPEESTLYLNGAEYRMEFCRDKLNKRAYFLEVNRHTAKELHKEVETFEKLFERAEYISREDLEEFINLELD